MGRIFSETCHAYSSCIFIMHIRPISWYQMFMCRLHHCFFFARFRMESMNGKALEKYLCSKCSNGFVEASKPYNQWIFSYWQVGGEVISKTSLSMKWHSFFWKDQIWDAHVFFCNFDGFSRKKCAWSLGWFHIMSPVSLAVSQALAVSILDLHGINSFSRPSAKMVLKEVSTVSVSEEADRWSKIRGLRGFQKKKAGYLGVAPSQHSSDHQDDITFLIGDPDLNLHLPLLLGGGHTQQVTPPKTNSSPLKKCCWKTSPFLSKWPLFRGHVRFGGCNFCAWNHHESSI